MGRQISAAILITALMASVPASALLVWKGRDGKAYTSVKDCFTNNPQCLPEQARVMAGGGGKAPAADAPASRSAAPALCQAADGWLRQPPCADGEAKVATPQ